MRHRKPSHDPAQLSLPGSLNEVVDLRSALERAEALAQSHFRASEGWQKQVLEESRKAQALAKENAALRHEVLVLRQKHIALNLELAQRMLADLGSTPATAQDQLSRELRRIVGLVHPDKWDGHPLSDLVTRELLGLRDKLN